MKSTDNKYSMNNKVNKRENALFTMLSWGGAGSKSLFEPDCDGNKFICHSEALAEESQELGISTGTARRCVW